MGLTKMKWFKHKTDASSGDTLIKIEREFGLEGYARWFKILERVGREMDKTGKCSADLHMNDWGSLLRCKPNKLETFLTYVAYVSDLSWKRSGDVLEIKVPSLLKIKDEYARKSGQAPDTLRTPIKELRVKSKELRVKNKENPIVHESAFDHVAMFEKIWSEYPERKAKKMALRHFTASVHSEKDFEDINTALANYKKQVELDRQNGRERYWQNGSTWFNNWQDWVDHELVGIEAKTPTKFEKARESTIGWAERFEKGELGGEIGLLEISETSNGTGTKQIKGH